MKVLQTQAEVEQTLETGHGSERDGRDEVHRFLASERDNRAGSERTVPF